MKRSRVIRTLIPVVVLVVIVTGSYTYFFLSGGAPWVNSQAQNRMVSLLRAKYPRHSFNIATHTTYNLNNHYQIGVVFDSKPSTEFFYELSQGKGGSGMLYFHPSQTDRVEITTATPAPGANQQNWRQKYRNTLPTAP